MNRAEREGDAWDRFYASQPRARTYKFYLAAAEARRQLRCLIADSCAGRRVLDYGCGTGHNAVALAELGATVVGIDVSAEAIRKARRRAGDNETLTFIRMDAEAMSFPDDHFDLIYGSSILHHLDVGAASREIARVLRPGGRAVFLEPLGHNVLINLYRRLTPALRTVDEHPLLMADLDTMAAHFEQMRVHHHALATLAMVPFRKLPGAGRLLGTLQAVDRVLFRVPAFRRQAWQVVIEARA